MTEVKNSNAMELESRKRQLKYLQDNGTKVQKLVTDRHNQVSTYMANEKPQVEHAYDVWHVAKGTVKHYYIWKEVVLHANYSLLGDLQNQYYINTQQYAFKLKSVIFHF